MRLRMVVRNAVTPFHLHLLGGVQSSIRHPEHGARLTFEPQWLSLWIQGWMGPQQVPAQSPPDAFSMGREGTRALCGQRGSLSVSPS